VYVILYIPVPVAGNGNESGGCVNWSNIWLENQARCQTTVPTREAFINSRCAIVYLSGQPVSPQFPSFGRYAERQA
jgi:hypothetical protein